MQNDRPRAKVSRACAVPLLFVVAMASTAIGCADSDDGEGSVDASHDAGFDASPDAEQRADSGADGAIPADAGDAALARDAEPALDADLGPPAARFVGRTDSRGGPGVTRFGWSGSGVEFRFSGTQAAVRMDDPSGFFTVLVDGMERPRLSTMSGERTYQIVSGLTPGTHQVEIYRRTEASFGATRFFGVELNGGELLPPPPARLHRLELIGDSISTGYGNEGADSSCSFEARTQNHWLTYGAIAARNLAAELVTVAWSGKGVIYNYDEDKNQPLPELYARAVPSDAQSSWDFGKWQPEVVVINLGTNDFSTGNDPAQLLFVEAYKDFLAQLRDNYPNAWIMCLVPTLLGGTDLSTARDYITQVVAQINAAGDSRVVLRTLQFQQQGAGCDYHPSLATHASMAESLTAQLRALAGW